MVSRKFGNVKATAVKCESPALVSIPCLGLCEGPKFYKAKGGARRKRDAVCE